MSNPTPEEIERMLAEDVDEDRALHDSVMAAQFAPWFLREVERRAGATREEILACADGHAPQDPRPPLRGRGGGEGVRIEVHHDCTKDNSYPIHLEDGTFHLDSCDSHSGCVAADDIKFCPYCGKALEAEKKEDT